MSIDIEKHLGAIESAVSSSAEKMARIYGPTWAAKGDLAKILITVSSGLLAAVLAFSKEILEGLSADLLCIAFVSMGGLLLTVITSVCALFAATLLSTFQARQFNRKPQLREKLSQLDETSPRFEKDLEAIWKPMLDSDLEPIGRAADRANQFLIAGVVVFVVSLALFMVFVVKKYGGT